MARPLVLVDQGANWHRAIGAGLLLIVLIATAGDLSAQYPAGPQITKDGTTILLQDYATFPLSSPTTGTYPPVIDFTRQLGRVNFLRSEPLSAPASSSRFFVNDLNRSLYILSRTSKAFTTYLNFEEIFPRFDNTPGYAGGLVTFAFGPDYPTRGTFYTVHTEDPAKSGPAEPTNALVPGLDLGGGYFTTAPVNPPAGTVVREAVLVEWTDTNITDELFQGTAREILRVGFNGTIHPMGDLLFNPTAFPGDADYGNLYVAIGDGQSGETAGATHTTPQRLDAVQGKVLRITPDTTLRPADSLGGNGRYRIPSSGSDPNPFVSLGLPNLKTEIYAYGFRNPHRLSWNPIANGLIVSDIGLDSWEEVNLVVKGANYGYAEREGDEQLFVGGANDGKTGSQIVPAMPFPSPDALTVGGVASPVASVYPALVYSHNDGDAIGSGFVYRGSQLPQLFGKYVFGDISTGRLFYADLGEMMTATRTSPAAIHEIQVVYSSPYNALGPVNRRLYDMVADAYAARGGHAGSGQMVLPGGAPVVGTSGPGRLDIDGVRYGGGRADVRVVESGDGEIFVLSKSDGMIREARAVPTLPPPPPVSTKFTIGQQVTPTQTPVNIRQTPAGTLLGTQSAGVIGAVVDGPIAAMFNGATVIWWRVDYATGVDGWEGEDTLRAYVASPLPATPTGLTATAGNARIDLSWTAVSGATSYNVKRAAASGGPYSTIAPSVTAIGYANTGLTNGTTYYYVVSAVSSGGESPNSAQVSATPGAGTPPPPVSTKFTIGQQVTPTQSPVNIRQTPAGTLLGTQSAGVIGAVVDGPIAAMFNGATVIWWRVDYATGVDGWEGEDTLLAYVASPAPATPTGLTATAGNARIDLSWTAVSGATTYNVKRAATSGGPYTTIGANVSSVTYANTGLTNGATYYYVVSATNGGGESSNSTQASATPAAGTPPAPSGLPSPWQTSDIGGVAAIGSASASNGTFTVIGSGADIWSTADEFRFVYQAASGDCEIRAHVTSVQNTDSWAKAGVMIRETLGAGSKHVAALVTPTQGAAFQRRTATGGTSLNTSASAVAAPYWLRVVRAANTFTAYRSSNGTTWTSMGSVTVTMGANVYIGLAVTSHNDGTLATAIMSNVTATP